MEENKQATQTVKKKFNKKLFLRITLSILLAGLIIGVIILGMYTNNRVGTIMGSEYSFITKGVHSVISNNKLLSLIEKNENIFSAEKEGSDIYKINNSEEGVKVSVSAETMELLLLAKEIYENSDGAFNIAIYPLTKLWKFDSANFNYSVKEAPNDEKIEELLQYCSFTKDNFILDKENLTVTKKHKECALDLGAMVKGYNLDIARKVAEKYGISNSLYSFGGSSILGYGKSYNLGLIDANNKERILGALLLPQNYCISTSGVYERFYKDSAGNSYHHILDKSGKPANSKVVGVTVVGKSGVVCDMISTAVVVLGAEKGRELMQKYDLYGIIILEGNKFTTVGRVGFSLELTDYERV